MTCASFLFQCVINIVFSTNVACFCFSGWFVFRDVFEAATGASCCVPRLKNKKTSQQNIFVNICKEKISVIRFVLRSPSCRLARPCIFDASTSCCQNPVCREDAIERRWFFCNPIYVYIYIYVCVYVYM